MHIPKIILEITFSRPVAESKCDYYSVLRFGGSSTTELNNGINKFFSGGWPHKIIEVIRIK